MRSAEFRSRSEPRRSPPCPELKCAPNASAETLLPSLTRASAQPKQPVDCPQQLCSARFLPSILWTTPNRLLSHAPLLPLSCPLGSLWGSVVQSPRDTVTQGPQLCREDSPLTVLGHLGITCPQDGLLQPPPLSKCRARRAPDRAALLFGTPSCGGAARATGGRGQSSGKGKGTSAVRTPGISSADALRLGNELSSPQLQDHMRAFLSGIPRERSPQDSKAPINRPDIRALL